MIQTSSTPSKFSISHAEMVAKLAKDGNQILTELTRKKCHLWHMATGLVGETIELIESTTNENKIEELGDIEFYAEGIRAAVGIKDFNLLSLEVSPHNQMLIMSNPAAVVASIGAGHVLDAVKKHVAYNKPLSMSDLMDGMALTRYGVESFMSICGFSRNQILEANMEKLSKRYPNFNFTNEAAQKRADKAEESTN